ncbi:DNA methyltransferase [Burkholderia gladioli]|uniref:DNA methyltransferase n=1 Tax=Burkholderia gladioli TaxID=28095 RepID=UPI001640193D|nr:DNA methyltransferase [Burkholderia gladioli]
MSLESEKKGYRQLSTLAHTRHTESSLAIHPYFGKVDPSIARTAIETFSKPKSTVLDPFCGSGTVIHDAVVMGRNVVGWDSSPLAVMISAAKVLGITSDETRELQILSREAEQLVALPLFADVVDDLAIADVPQMPRVRSVGDWFSTRALTELAAIKRLLRSWATEASGESYLLAKVAFSRIITAASLQQSESTYRRIVKPDEPGRVVGLFVKSLRHVIRSAAAFSAEMAQGGIDIQPCRLLKSTQSYSISHDAVNVKLISSDSRTACVDDAKTRASLVVTSPPYLMSWDYGLYHKFRFYWLDFDLDSYEDSEIGRHLRRKKDDVPRYIEDMQRVFARLRKATAPTATSVFVNAPSVVYGKEVDTNALLIDCGAASNWKLEWSSASLGIPGPHHGMYSSLQSRGANAPGKAGKTEHLLVFSRDPMPSKVSDPAKQTILSA